MKINYTYICSLLLFIISSCNFFEKDIENDLIASVNDVYLYKSEYLEHLPDNLSKKDSLLFANQYINNWATKQLLKQKALLNLDDEMLSSFDQLANDYKLDLYSNAYLNVLIKKQLDTLINQSEFDTVYKYSKKNFKLNEVLIKYRFLSIDKDYRDLNTLISKFKRFNKKDKILLDSLSIQFNSFMLNDTMWVKKSQAFEKLPILKTVNNSELLKKSNFLQFEDSIRVYLVQVNDLLFRHDQAPKAYVEKTLEQIILNKRKLKLIKQLEIDVRKDAIQNEEFQIYD